MKADISNYQDDKILLECIKSAYEDLQVLLQWVFTNINKHPNQLTFSELFSLFICYDWNDIFNHLEELENCNDLFYKASVYSSIIETLKADSNIIPLNDPRGNTYYKVWAGLMTDEDF